MGYVHYYALVLSLLSFLGDCTLNGMIILDVKSISLQFSCQVKFNSGQTSYFYSSYCGLFIISNGYSPYLVVFFFTSTIASDCENGLKLKINVLSRSLIVFLYFHYKHSYTSYTCTASAQCISPTNSSSVNPSNSGGKDNGKSWILGNSSTAISSGSQGGMYILSLIMYQTKDTHSTGCGWHSCYFVC